MLSCLQRQPSPPDLEASTENLSQIEYSPPDLEASTGDLSQIDYSIVFRDLFTLGSPAVAYQTLPECNEALHRGEIPDVEKQADGDGGMAIRMDEIRRHSRLVG